MGKFLGALVFAFSLIYVSMVQSAEQHPLQLFEGTYLGFSPTDESPIKFGEIEITIKENSILIRMATGHKIEEATMDASEFKLMATEELKKLFIENSEYLPRVTGFTARGFTYLFLKDAGENEFGITRLGGLGDILGPTLLFSPGQIARGEYQNLLAEIEKDEHRKGKGLFPRLKNGGRVEEKIKIKNIKHPRASWVFFILVLAFQLP